MIVDDQAIDTIPVLSSKLRHKTLERACQLDGGIYTHYTPWLCIRPFRDANLAHFEISKLTYPVGRLMTDKIYLENVVQFLNLHRELSLDLLPGNPNEWKIYTEVELSNSPIIKNFENVIHFIRQSSSFFNGIFDALVDMVIPMSQQKPQGFSNVQCRGAIFLSYPEGYDKLSMALDFVHEMGHQALFLFQSVDPLITNGSERLIFSEIRRTKRPAILCLHAAVAIAFMLKFSQDARILHHKHHDFEDSLGETLMRSVDLLKRECEFSGIGNRILKEFVELAN